ncbi:MAG: hypothetical protein ABEH58_05855 [Haloplanus sp.]
MAHDRLQQASEELRAAAEAADGEERERLGEQADQLATLADRGTDHGRLARHENALREIKAAAGDDVGERIEAAMDAITAYRETLEGV